MWMVVLQRSKGENMKQYVLITGASSGVGRELAIELSEKYSLILNGRNYDQLLETKNQCKTENILIWQYDLSETKQLEEKLKEWLKMQDVQVSAFVHCAGVMKMLPCKVFSYDQLMETYQVNVFSAAMILKILTNKRVNGKTLTSVVFISSNISNRGAKAFGVYGSSKAALDGLMRNLAIELAPSVRINSILPGGMITKMTEEMFENDEVKEQFNKAYPLGMGTPSQIAPMVDFLISEKASWITGQQLVIDGGRTVDITEKA